MKKSLLLFLLLNSIIELQAQNNIFKKDTVVSENHHSFTFVDNADIQIYPSTAEPNKLPFTNYYRQLLMDRLVTNQTSASPKTSAIAVHSASSTNKIEEAYNGSIKISPSIIRSSRITLSAPETIIGEDDRKQILEENAVTNTIGIVYSSFSYDDASNKCTGTSIGDDYIITAAHCVYDRKLNKLAEDIAFVPGLFKSRAVYDDRYFAQEVHIVKSFKEGEFPSLHDIAIIKVRNEDLPNVSEEFGFLSISAFTGERVTGDLYSYPADKKDAHSLWKEKGCLNVRHESGVITSSCDTYPGASGAALIDSHGRVIAINSAERDHANLFSPITPSIRQAIDNIKRRGRDINFFSSKTTGTHYYSVHLRNNCDREIKVAILYSKISSSKKETEGYFHVEPGQVVHNVIKTREPILGLYAIDETGELEWWGRDFTFETESKTLNFYKEDLPPIWKDKTFSFKCDGY